MVAAAQPAAAARDGIRERIAAIQREVAEGRYHPGPWEALLRDTRMLPRAERALLADEISTVSRKLHDRAGYTTMSLMTGLAAEIALSLVGAVFIIFAAKQHSIWLADLFVILAAAIWMMTFQPLFKVGVGSLLGVKYEYAYLFGAEPRFKMRYADSLAAPRWALIVLHLSGMIGSPLGVWLPTICIGKDLWVAADFCWVVFWIVVAVN